MGRKLIIAFIPMLFSIILFSLPEVYAEIVSITVDIQTILLEPNQVIPLIDTKNVANLTKLQVSATLPCDANNVPKLKIIAGALGNLTDVISLSSDYKNLRGPFNTCYYEDVISTQSNLPMLNKVFLKNDGNSSIVTNIGSVVTLSGFYAGSSSVSSPYPDGLGSTADGTAYNGVTTSQTGKIGNAWSFDGSNDYVSIGANNLITGTGDFTISAWVYPNSVHSGTIIGSYPTTGDFDFYVHGNAKQVMNLQASGYCFSSTSYSANQWNHLLVTRINGVVQYYINGNADNSCTNAGNIVAAPTRIGGSTNVNGPTEPLNGKLDELSVWSRALSTSEISALYNSGNGQAPNSINTSGLKAYYNFEQTGTTLTNQAVK